MVRTAGGRVQAAMNTLLVLSAVGNEGQKGLIMVVHHTGKHQVGRLAFAGADWVSQIVASRTLQMMVSRRA